MTNFPEIKTRTTLVKLLNNAGIKDYAISGRGKSLEVKIEDKYYDLFVTKVANNWSGNGNGYIWMFRKNEVNRPQTAYDFNDKSSVHHY